MGRETSMKRLSRQRGLGMLGWVAVIGVVVFFGTLAAKLMPVYVDNMTVRSIIQAVAADPEAGGKSAGQLRSEISRQFITNRVEVINPRDIKFKYERNVITVDASYEVRVPVMYNVDAVVRFDNQTFEIQRR